MPGKPLILGMTLLKSSWIFLQTTNLNQISALTNISQS